MDCSSQIHFQSTQNVGILPISSSAEHSLPTGQMFPDFFILEESDILSPNFRFTVNLYLEGIVDKNGWLEESQIPNVPIPHLDKEELLRAEKPFREALTIKGKNSFECQVILSRFLNDIEKESSFFFESKSLVGSGVAWVESLSYHQRIFGQYGSKVLKLNPEALRVDLLISPDDLDCRFNDLRANKEIRQRLRYAIINQIALRIPWAEQLNTRSLVKQFGFKKLCDVDDIKPQGNHYFIAAFGNSKLRFELAVVQNLARPNLSSIDAQKLPLGTLLSAILSNKKYPKIVPESNFKNGVRQAIFDLYGKVVHFIDIGSMDIKACVRLLSYLTKGYCSPDPGSITIIIERLLILTDYKKKILALKEREWAEQMGELLIDCCKSHHQKNIKALLALLINLSVNLQQSQVIPTHISLIWDKVIQSYFKRLAELKQKNRLVDPSGLLHCIAKAYQTSAIPYEGILDLLHLKAFIYLNVRTDVKELISRKVFFLKNNGLPASQITIDQCSLVMPLQPLASLKSLLLHTHAFVSKKGEIEELLQEISCLLTCQASFRQGGSSLLSSYSDYLNVEGLQNIAIDQLVLENTYFTQLSYELLLACHSLKPTNHLKSILFTYFSTAISKVSGMDQELFFKSLENIAHDIDPNVLLNLSPISMKNLESLEKSRHLKLILLLAEIRHEGLVQLAYLMCDDALLRYIAKEQKNVLFNLINIFKSYPSNISLRFLIDLQEKKMLSVSEERRVFLEIVQAVRAHNSNLILQELTLSFKAVKNFFNHVSLSNPSNEKEQTNYKQVFTWLIPPLFRSQEIPKEEALQLFLEASRRELILKNSSSGKLIGLNICEDILNHSQEDLSLAVAFFEELQKEFGIQKILQQGAALILELVKRLYALQDFRRGDEFLRLLLQGKVEAGLKSEVNALQEEHIQRLIDANELNQASQELSIQSTSLEAEQKASFKLKILRAEISKKNLQFAVDRVKNILKEGTHLNQIPVLRTLIKELLTKLCDKQVAEDEFSWNLNQAYQLLLNEHVQKLFNLCIYEQRELLLKCLETALDQHSSVNSLLISDLLEIALKNFTLDASSTVDRQSDIKLALFVTRVLSELWRPPNVLSKGLKKQIRNTVDHLYHVLNQGNFSNKVSDFFLALDFHQIETSLAKSSLKICLDCILETLRSSQSNSQKVYSLEQALVRDYINKAKLPKNLLKKWTELPLFFVAFYFNQNSFRKGFDWLQGKIVLILDELLKAVPGKHSLDCALTLMDAYQLIEEKILYIRTRIDLILNDSQSHEERKTLETLLIRTLINSRESYFFTEAYGRLRKLIYSRENHGVDVVNLFIELIEKASTIENQSLEQLYLIYDLTESFKKTNASDLVLLQISAALYCHPAILLTLVAANLIIIVLNSHKELSNKSEQTHSLLATFIKPLLTKLIKLNDPKAFTMMVLLLSRNDILHYLTVSEQIMFWNLMLAGMLKDAPAEVIIEAMTVFIDKLEVSQEHFISTIKPLLIRLINFDLSQGYALAQRLLLHQIFYENLSDTEKSVFWGLLINGQLKNSLVVGNIDEIKESLLNFRKYFHFLKDNKVFEKSCVEAALANILNLFIKHHEIDLFKDEYYMFSECLEENLIKHIKITYNSISVSLVKSASENSGSQVILFSKPEKNENHGQKKLTSEDRCIEYLKNALHKILETELFHVEAHQYILLELLNKELLFLFNYFPSKTKELIELLDQFIFHIHPCSKCLFITHFNCTKHLLDTAVKFNIVDIDNPSATIQKFLLYTLANIKVKDTGLLEILDAILMPLLNKKTIFQLRHAIEILANTQTVILKNLPYNTEKYYLIIIQVFKTDFFNTEETFLIYQSIKNAILGNILFTAHHRSKEWQNTTATICASLFNALCDNAQTTHPSNFDLIEEAGLLLKESLAHNFFESNLTNFHYLLDKLQKITIKLKNKYLYNLTKCSYYVNTA